jgi:hypothetical protein
MKNVVGMCSIAVLALLASACTFKGTTNQTTDTTSNITGTTSGKSWFEGGLVKKDQEVNAFADLNFDNLKQNMAAGHGEYLASLGSLMGVTPAHQNEFFALTQAHYTTLVGSEQTTPTEMLVALNQILAAPRAPRD